MQTLKPSLTLSSATLIALAFIALAGLGGAWLGYAEDLDSLGIGQSVNAILAGGYQRSRVLGAPLYELTAAGLTAIGGIVLVNLASLAMTLGAALFLAATLKRVGGKGAPFALIAAACSPLMLINASAMMETAMLALWVTAALWAATKAVAAPTRKPLILAAAFSALCAATRPDAALFALAVGASLAVMQREKPVRAMETLAWFAGFGLCAIGLYGLLNGGYAFVGEVGVTQDEAGRSLARAVLGMATVLGLFGAVVVGVTLARVARDPQDALLRVRRALPAQRLILWIAIAAGGLYAVRFIALPDELEYLLPALLALCAAFGVYAGRITCAALAASLVLANGAQLALFERSGERIAPAVSLQPGALTQDWALRRHNLWLRSPDTTAALAALAGAPGTTPDRTHFWLNGLTFQGNAVVLGEDQLYRFLTVDDPGNPHWLGHYATIVVCPTPLVPRRGWRVLQPMPDRMHGPTGWREGCQSISPAAQAPPGGFTLPAPPGGGA